MHGPCFFGISAADLPGQMCLIDGDYGGNCFRTGIGKVYLMKKGQQIIGRVVRMDYPNKGIVEAEEGTLKVATALPGQTVRCSVKKAKKGIGEGILREVIERSPDEIDSPCPHAGRCGGCLYQTFPYEKELEIKEGQVHRLLEPVVALQQGECVFDPIAASPRDNGYRNKMEFTFGDEYKDGPLALGMHRRGSMYDIETVTSCLIVDPDYCRIIEATLEYFRAKSIPYYHRVRHEGYLRHLLVRRTTTGQILLALVTSSQNPWHSEELINGYKDVLLNLEQEEGKLNGKFAGILHIINDSLADAVKADEIVQLYGESYITEKLLGLEFKITPFSFFQTNTYGAEVLYSKVREYAEGLPGMDGGSIYDLYSGTGTITQIMGKSAAKAVGVEIVEEAVEAAKENAELNGLHNCEFMAGDVLKVLDSLTEKPDLIILDPPRDGIHPKALPKIIAYGVENIIYVSCKTTSLARDLEILIEAGYEAKRICPVDQFPKTGNIETVVLLSNRKTKPDTYVNIGVDVEDYYKIKSEE